MMQPSSGPGRILDQNPQHYGSKERSGSSDLLDRHRVAFASYEQRELVDDNQAGEQNRIHPPSEEFIATEPKWTPRQACYEHPQQNPVYVGASSRDLRP